MRISATLMLVAMAVVFAIAFPRQDMHPAWGYIRAFAEAGMIGGLADWFAVTALFRHPLGLPIPHTAIIPRNKDRIADTMADFLRRNFLTPHVVARRLQDMNLAAALGGFLVERRSSDAQLGRIRSGTVQLLVDLLEALDPERLGLQVKAGLAAQARKLEVSPLLGRMLAGAMEDGRHRPVIDALVRWAGLTLEGNEELVREMIRARANAVLRWTGLDDRLSSSVLDGLYRLLAEILVDPQHPLRGRMEEGLAKLAADLQSDPALRAKVERAKLDLLANPALGDWWMGVWERIRHGMIAAARDPDAALDGQLGAALRELGEKLQSDPALQAQINRLARRTLVGVAQRYGEQIVRLVSETVKRWDAQTITDRIENAVGRDLQFIRINGTLVGGLVGVALHAITQLF
ncbi:DUF445 domain-containing protein [Alteraurantiacibacter palmitatis]|uniref:DUF445 domain-containing protein n=1 Tax=Alteraurantiacibacter palmitatis TaxID=2054628 RepID=A0ABV7E3R9_9SPHN